MSKSRTAKEISKLKRVINHHINSGGNAHLPATEATTGMMTEKQVKQLNSATGQRIYMPHETDILAIEPGHYEIANALNNPIGPDDASFIEYDISVDPADGKRRQIRAVVSGTDEVFHRTIHSDGTPESGTDGWRKQAFETPIWSGNVNSGTITFARPIPTHHMGIKVCYTTISNQQGSVRPIHKLSGAITDTNHPNDTSDNTFQSYELNFTFDKNSLKITQNNMKILAAGKLNNYDTKGISITDVFLT